MLTEEQMDLGFGVSIVNRFTRNRMLHFKDTMMGVLSSVKHMKLSPTLTYRRNAHKIVRGAYDAGFRIFDTARIYGFSEAELGKGLSGIPRENYFICTKVSDMDLTRMGGASDVRGNLMNSLADLQMDYVDLYLLHWPSGDWVDMYAQMCELHKEGLARNIGVCNFSLEHFAELEKHPDLEMPSYCQIESHPLYHNQEVIDYCAQKGIRVIAHTPTGRMCPEIRRNTVIREIGEKYGMSVAQVILRWHMQRGIIPITHTKSLQHINENTAVRQFTLSEEEMRRIDSVETGKKFFTKIGIDNPNYAFNK